MGEPSIVATGDPFEVVLEGKDGVHEAIFEGIGADDGGDSLVLIFRCDDGLYEWPLGQIAVKDD